MSRKTSDHDGTPGASNVTWLSQPGNVTDDLNLVARALEGIARTLGDDGQTTECQGAAATLALSIGRLRALAESLRETVDPEEDTRHVTPEGESRNETIKKEIAEILAEATPAAENNDDSPTVVDVTAGGTTVRIRIEQE